MDEMTWIALLFGAFAGFVIGVVVAAPRVWYRGGLVVQDDISDLSVYLQGLMVGVIGAVVGLIIAALLVF